MSREQVFISYASEDRAQVEPYVRAFETAGFAVWFDQTALSTGDSIVEGIDRGLAESQLALIFFSDSYQSKVWTREEMAALLFAAISSGELRVAAIRLDETPLPPLLAHRLWFRPDSPADVVTRLAQLGDGGAPPADPSPSPGRRADWQEIDGRSLETVARHVLENLPALHRATSKTVRTEVYLPTLGALIRLEILAPALTDELVADLRSCLEIARAHGAYVRDLEEDLAQGALGKFKAGFRIELEKRMNRLDQAWIEIRRYLQAICEQLLIARAAGD